MSLNGMLGATTLADPSQAVESGMGSAIALQAWVLARLATYEVAHGRTVFLVMAFLMCKHE